MSTVGYFHARYLRCTNCGGAAQVPCDKCLQQGKVREYEEILIEW